jgi:hypothetical protein
LEVRISGVYNQRTFGLDGSGCEGTSRKRGTRLTIYSKRCTYVREREGESMIGIKERNEEKRAQAKETSVLT